MQDENKKEEHVINKNLNKKEEYLKKKEEFRIKNKDLKDKINSFKKENKKIKEKVNITLDKNDDIVLLEKYAEVINNKCIFLKDKLHYSSFFTYPKLYVKFNYRNIFLPINLKKTYGFHYCYSCHYKDFEIGFKSDNFMIAKLIPNFYLNVFLYYYKRKNKLIVSVDGQIKDEKNNWIYSINTMSKNPKNTDIQEIECLNYNDFKWPIKHNVKFKDSSFNDTAESIVKISNEKIK